MRLKEQIAMNRDRTEPDKKDDQYEEFICSLTHTKDRYYAIVKIGRMIFHVKHWVAKRIFFKWIAGSTNYKEYINPLKSYIKWKKNSI